MTAYTHFAHATIKPIATDADGKTQYALYLTYKGANAPREDKGTWVNGLQQSEIDEIIGVVSGSNLSQPSRSNGNNTTLSAGINATDAASILAAFRGLKSGPMVGSVSVAAPSQAVLDARKAIAARRAARLAEASGV
jgi:hypothetical protein